jgi:hypothetical protein
MRKRVYDIVKEVLLKSKAARNSDKFLMFLVWRYQEFGTGEGISFNNYEDFKAAAHPKSIIEARRNLQREQEEKIARGIYIGDDELLVADKQILKMRDLIDAQKGTHIFRDSVIL